MSKTIRRKNGRQPEFGDGFRKEKWYYSEGHKHYHFLKCVYSKWYWQSDMWHDSGPVKRNVKWHSDWQRRSDEKKFLSDIKKGFESNEPNEKKYKGLWWSYD